MIKHTSPIRKFPAYWLAPVFMSLALAACDMPENRPADYRAAHPLLVSKETVSMSVKVPLPSEGLRGRDALDLDAFVRDYHNRGRQALTIKAGSQGSLASAEQVRGLLVDAGIRAREISISRTGFKGDSVIVSFSAHKVQVPECADWSSSATFNWSNRPHSNYGCATQRNLGLMVQDPGDLEKARTMSDSDGQKAGGVIGSYRAPPAPGGGGAAPAAAP